MMRIRRRFGITALAMVLGGVGAMAAMSCGADPGPPIPPVAPVETDAAIADTRPAPVKDTGRDVTRDTAPDYDANPWDGDVPLPGEWLPIPGLPASCAARIAKDPKVAFPAFVWRPCTSGRPGCEVFMADGSRGGDNFIVSKFSPYEDAKGVHLAHSRLLERSKYRTWVVHPLHGDAEFAVFGTSTGTDYCVPAKVHGSSMGYGMTVMQEEGEAGILNTWAAWSPITAPNALNVERVTDALGGLPLVQGLAHGDGFMAFEQTAGGRITASAFRFADRTLVTSTPGNTLGSDGPMPVQGGYFAKVTAEAFMIGFMPLEGGYRTVVRPLPGCDVRYAYVDRTNSDALVWTEQSRTTSEVILYTSPFTTQEGTLARRAVARLVGNVGGVVNAGVFAHTIGPERTLRLIRLSDGQAWEVAGEADAPTVFPIWVNATSAWAMVSSLLPGEPGYPIWGGLLQVARPQGPPTIPNGF